MADFSQYTGPSDEWIALERTLPADPEGLTPEQLKAAVNKTREQLAARDMIEQGFDQKVALQTYSIPTRDGFPLEARSYRPIPADSSQQQQRLPIYIHLHGGGFLFGTLSSDDSICARIVASLADAPHSLPIIVVNVNYRHTPEHRYPTAWNDVEDAFHWVHDNIALLGGDADRVIMGGISAGAWLTASTVLAQHLATTTPPTENGNGTGKALSARPKLKGQVLMIPALVHFDCYAPQLAQLAAPEVSSWVSNRDAPILPLDRVKLFTGLLGMEGGKDMERDLRMNPGNVTAEEVRGLPPTTFGVAGRDPLRDEGLFYAKLLSENGVPTRTNVFSGLPHGFRRYGQLSASKKWDEVMVDGIRWALSDPVSEPFEIRAF